MMLPTFERGISRRFLLGGAVSAGALVGCAPPRVTDIIEDHDCRGMVRVPPNLVRPHFPYQNLTDRNWRPRLSPGAGELAVPLSFEGSKGLDGVPIVIDSHTHVFNADDIPIKGFLRGPFQHFPGNDQSWIDDLVHSFAAQFQQLANRRAPNASVERDILENLILGRGDHRESEQYQRDAGRLAALIVGASNSYRGNININSADRREGIEAFVRRILMPRYVNCERLLNLYSPRESSPAPIGMASNDEIRLAVDAYIVAMVDYDHWFDGETSASSLGEQAQIHELLALASHGGVLPVVGFNPLADMLSNGAHLQAVEYLILNRGFIGIKIYPPSGFRPIGNSVQQPSPCLSWPVQDPGFGARLDRRMRALYRLAQRLQVPIMAHASHSLGRSNLEEDFAGPDGWRRVLQEFPGLRVNFAHFGGDNGYSLSQNFQWMDELIRLMLDPRIGQNAYADLSYMMHVVRTQRRYPFGPLEIVQSELRERLLSSVIQRPEIARKLMYGSDWFMIVQERGYPSYLAGLEFFLRSVIEPAVRLSDRAPPNANHVRGDVMGGNAIRLYGLHPGGQNWARLTDYYRRYGLVGDRRPNWMKKVANSWSQLEGAVQP